MFLPLFCCCCFTSELHRNWFIVSRIFIRKYLISFRTYLNTCQMGELKQLSEIWLHIYQEWGVVTFPCGGPALYITNQEGASFCRIYPSESGYPPSPYLHLYPYKRDLEIKTLAYCNPRKQKSLKLILDQASFLTIYRSVIQQSLCYTGGLMVCSRIFIP
jgi:hypothetical protein